MKTPPPYHQRAMTFEPDVPPMPTELRRSSGALYWVISGIAAALLVVGAWRAWQWFEGDVECLETLGALHIAADGGGGAAVGDGQHAAVDGDGVNG